MRYKLFGKSGLRVSEICLGTMTFGREWGWGCNYKTSKEIFDYYIWLEEQNIVPTIKAINNKFDEIREQEFDFFKNKIKETDVDKVEQLTKRIVSKIAAYSIEHLRNNKSSEDISIELLKDIYKLDSEN